MESYLYWSGVALNLALAGFIALVIWVWFIWPAVEAASMCRMVWSAGHRRPLSAFRHFYGKVLFGRDFTRISGKANVPGGKWWAWEGVGKWSVSAGDE